MYICSEERARNGDMVGWRIPSRTRRSSRECAPFGAALAWRKSGLALPPLRKVQAWYRWRRHGR